MWFFCKFLCHEIVPNYIIRHIFLLIKNTLFYLYPLQFLCRGTLTCLYLSSPEHNCSSTDAWRISITNSHKTDCSCLPTTGCSFHHPGYCTVGKLYGNVTIFRQLLMNTYDTCPPCLHMFWILQQISCPQFHISLVINSKYRLRWKY